MNRQPPHLISHEQLGSGDLDDYPLVAHGLSRAVVKPQRRRRREDAVDGVRRWNRHDAVTGLREELFGLRYRVHFGLGGPEHDVAAVRAGAAACVVGAPDLQPRRVAPEAAFFLEPSERAVGQLVGHRRGPLVVVADLGVERIRGAAADEDVDARGVHGEDHDHGRDVPERQRDAQTMGAQPGQHSHASPSRSMKPTPRTV